MPRAEPPGTAGAVRAESAAAAAGLGHVNAKELGGVALLTLSALLTLRGLGVWWSDVVVAPVVLTSAGVAVIWRGTSAGRADATPATAPRAAATGTPGRAPSPPAGPPAAADAGPATATATRAMRPGVSTPLGELPRLGPRLVVGAVLVAAGGASLLQATAAIGTLRDVALATLVVLAGVTLIFGTSWFGLVRTLREERAERVRSQERAEMAAHLHDSVLQTLALIQRRAGENGEVAALARRQERELRDWLAGRPVAAPGEEGGTLAAALQAMASAVEGDHHVPVEVVVVGDRPLDGDGVRALVAAAREATVNAAVHGGAGRVDVFAEVGTSTEVYVRDRGAGFDSEAVPAGRRGVRESIVGRMERHGGSATVRSAPGEGTEVALVLP